MTEEQYEKARKRTIEYLDKAGIALADEEKQKITVFDFGLKDLDNLGLELLVYVNTPRVCAKELVLFPRQTCVEHLHPTIGGVSGKRKHSGADGARFICMCRVNPLLTLRLKFMKT